LESFPGDELFKIQSVVDPHCRATTDFSKNTRAGSDKHELHSDDGLRLTLEGRSYLLDLGDGDTLRLSFTSFSP
jgi:hypothetical protein